MSTVLVIPDVLAAELEEAAQQPLETAGVLLVSVVENPTGGIRLLARKLIWVEESAYARREVDSLSIPSLGYVHALAEAEKLGVSAMWVHTHPGIDSSPLPSRHDLVVDTQISELFRIRTGSYYYGSLIISPTPHGISFSGQLHRSGAQPSALDRLWLVGDRFWRLYSYGLTTSGLSGAFDRNVRAFGAAVQSTLADLDIGIVGCGGTGSVVAEQLIRLGVQRVTLVDPESLSVSNVTRVYGSSPAMVGIPKVDVLGEHLLQISPEAQVRRIKSSVILESVARDLVGCDLIFGCTDDNAGRLVLSRIATYLMIPVIDCGVLLTADARSQLVGINGRVTSLVPGQACLVCRGRIDLKRAATESLAPEERTRRIDEGYAPALGGAEPAVVAFTTAVGAAAVGELLERLIGYGPEPRPSEVILRFHEREVSTNRAAPLPLHYCCETSGKLGVGVTTPFLDQLWPA